MLCSKCGAEMSETDDVCNQCGQIPDHIAKYPRFGGGGVFMVMWVFFIVLIIVMLVSMFSMN